MTRSTTSAPIDPSDVTIAYIGDGRRQWAPNLIQDLAQSPLDGRVRLYDAFPESAKQNARFGNWVQEREVGRPRGVRGVLERVTNPTAARPATKNPWN